MLTDAGQNALFPNLSEIDRVSGAVDYRKLFAACVSQTSDTYYGAHVIIDAVPTDPAQTVLLYRSPVADMPAGVSETRPQVIAAMNAGATDDGGPGWYGCKPLLADVAAGSKVVRIDSPRVQLIPRADAVVPAEGDAEFAQRKIPALAVGPTNLAPNFVFPTSGPALLVLPTLMAPGGLGGSVEGAFDDNTQNTPTGQLSAPAADGVTSIVLSGQLGAVSHAYVEGQSVYALVPGIVGIVDYLQGTLPWYTPAWRVNLSEYTHTVAYTSASTPAIVVTLPHLPAVASESITWTDDDGVEHQLVNSGPTEFERQGSASASINRSTGGLFALLLPPPAISTQVVIRYARADQLLPLGSGAVSGSIDGGGFDVTTASGYVLAGAVWRIGSDVYRIESGSELVYRVADDGQAVPAGAYNATTGRVAVVAQEGAQVTDWSAAQYLPQTGLATAHADMTLPALLDGLELSADFGGGVVTVAADDAGVIPPGSGIVAGQYLRATGRLSLTLSAPWAGVVSWSADQTLPGQLVAEDIAGVNPALFADDGTVRAFRADDVIVVGHQDALAPQTVSDGQTVSCGRTGLSEIRVIGADGVEIFAGYSTALGAGTVTFSDVSGYSQPVTIRHRVEDTNRAVSVSDAGEIVLSRPLTRSYAAGSSYVASALFVGDMWGRVGSVWELASWAGDWAQITGTAPATARFAQELFPVTTTNAGATTENFAFVFTSTTAFKVVSENGGVIGTGTTGSDVSVLNPVTRQPYFTLPAAGWGLGWAVGNVLMMPTYGAISPVWVVRCVSPGALDTQQIAGVSLRGNI